MRWKTSKSGRTSDFALAIGSALYTATHFAVNTDTDKLLPKHLRWRQLGKPVDIVDGASAFLRAGAGNDKDVALRRCLKPTGRRVPGNPP